VNVAFYLLAPVVVVLALFRPWSRRQHEDVAGLVWGGEGVGWSRRDVSQAGTAEDPTGPDVVDDEPEPVEPRTYGVGGAIEVGS
jgi:hypothetical protein